VVKLVDAGDSKSPAARRAGSIPASGTSEKPLKINGSQKGQFLLAFCFF